MRKIFRLLSGSAFLFGGPILLLLGGLALAWVLPIFGPIRPEGASRELMIHWLTWRDLSTQSPEVVESMLIRCESEFGRRSGRPLVFDLSPSEKARYAGASADDTLFSRNIDTLAKKRLISLGDRFESGTVEERKSILDDCLDDFAWWEGVYLDFLEAIDEPIPSKMKLGVAFHRMLNRFSVGEDKETVRRIHRFRRALTGAALAREFRNSPLYHEQGLFAVCPPENSTSPCSFFRTIFFSMSPAFAVSAPPFP